MKTFAILVLACSLFCSCNRENNEEDPGMRNITATEFAQLMGRVESGKYPGSDRWRNLLGQPQSHS